MNKIRISVAAALLVAGIASFAASNPFRATPGWGDIGREWGSTSAVYTTADGNVWVAERCGQNDCTDRRDMDNVFLFNSDGELLKSFGAGVFVWPHGINVDGEGNVWVTDARGDGTRGHQVHKFSADGELLKSLGKAVARPLSAGNISSASFFRTIQAVHPTLLVDEFDAHQKDRGWYTD